MTKRRKPNSARPVDWTPLERAERKPLAASVVDWAREQVRDAPDPEAALLSVLDLRDESTMYVNHLYVVSVKDMDSGLTWLSIRRTDRKPIRDWRHFQRIKNELCGPDREAVELYPAESRLVDEANQYHLWVLPAGERVPFGFNERQVGDSVQASRIGARQRDFD